MSEELTELEAASKKLRDLDKRRKDQQAYRDHLIKKAQDAGHGWAEIKRATGMQDRSLALALKRIEKE